MHPIATLRVISSLGDDTRERTKDKRMNQQDEHTVQTTEPPAIPQAAPTTIATQTSPPGELFGVHGWLRFWVVVRIYLDPIFTVIIFILAWIGYVSLADQHGGGIIVSGLIETAVAVFLTVRGIQVGIGLRDIKPRAVQSAKQWLLFVLAWAFVSPVPALLLGFPGELLGPEAIKSIVKTLISFAIWYSYFNVSKRVKSTYSDSAEK